MLYVSPPEPIYSNLSAVYESHLSPFPDVLSILLYFFPLVFFVFSLRIFHISLFSYISSCLLFSLQFSFIPSSLHFPIIPCILQELYKKNTIIDKQYIFQKKKNNNCIQCIFFLFAVISLFTAVFFSLSPSPHRPVRGNIDFFH